MPKKGDIDDRFKRFGTVSFTAISKTNDFIDFLDEGRVCGTACRKCGAVFFPPRADCCHCVSSDMKWFEISGTGKLVGFSKLTFAPLGFEADVPYCIALLDYGSYKIFGRIADTVDPADLAVGMPMKTVPNTLPNGQRNYVFEIG